MLWIWMENHSRNAVIGGRGAPYETSLAHACATATAYHAVGSPSLPNYIAATSGDSQGIRDDAGPRSHPVTSDNLFRQVRVSGGRGMTYAESMPSACALASAGTYAVKHNPAAYYVGADDREACFRDVRPLGTPTQGDLARQLQADQLPAFTLVIPNLCHDTHDCPVASGDRWLSTWVPALTASPAYRAGRLVVIIAWDEPSPMPMIAIAPSIAPGTVLRSALDHYALLRTTEDLLGLPPLAHATTASGFERDLGLR
ncbi:MAG: phosphoesterase [Acidobacteria bacterium]|nr:phosphoesterase [Acidobacteriota bacterium]